LAYCHECGAKVKRNAMFCKACGTPVKNRGMNSSEKKNILTMILMAVFLVALYIALDIYAISRIVPGAPPKISSDYRITLVSTITLKNPTFVPVICSRITYGDNARTGFIFMLPYSETTAEMSSEINPTYHGILGPLRVQIGDEQ
jgi:hypothetical protein